MTIEEAYKILNGVKESQVFSGQRKRLDDITKKVEGIIKDLDAANERQEKKKSGRSIIPSSGEYQISPTFEKHLESLKTWSRLDSPEQWAKQVAQDIHVEENRSAEYNELSVQQTDCFVEEMRQQICTGIADITLDGESKQWISTIVGLIIDFVLLGVYGLFVFKCGPFSTWIINDAVAGFIGAVGSVATVVLTLIVCASINRNKIRQFDKNHAIKYSELVRASKTRNSFKKSMMLMSFSGDFEEIKKRDLEIYKNTNELLKYSITSENFLKANSQKLDGLESRIKNADECLKQSLHNENELKNKVDELNIQLKIANERLMQSFEEASKERQQFHEEAYEQAQSYRREMESLQLKLEEANKELNEKHDVTHRYLDIVDRDLNTIKTLIQQGYCKQPAELMDKFDKDGLNTNVSANQIFELRWKIYCNALRNEYDDICTNNIGGFSKEVSKYRAQFLSAAVNCGLSISKDSVRTLENNIKNVLNPDSRSVKKEAELILDEFVREIHCEDSEFQKAWNDYIEVLRNQYDDICINNLGEFKNQESRDRLLTIAKKIGIEICRKNLLDLQQKIICILRPESRSAKQQADKVLDKFINNFEK